MDKIAILNANNQNMQVEVVRYFREGDNRYFIFSLHEIDDQGRMNIYVTKVVEQNGMLIGSNIIDDVEWTNLKTTIQRIIKENRNNGNAVVNDLSAEELSNIKVLDRRALKLLANSVDVLNTGYKTIDTQVQESISEVNNISDNIENVSQTSSQPTQSINQNLHSQQQNNGLDIFNTQVNTAQSVNMQQPRDISQNNQQTTNQIFDNYKELYFQEKENNQKLLEENNKLINELNNCKMIISDIKNILSR